MCGQHPRPPRVHCLYVCETPPLSLSFGRKPTLDSLAQPGHSCEIRGRELKGHISQPLAPLLDNPSFQRRGGGPCQGPAAFGVAGLYGPVSCGQLSLEWIVSTHTVTARHPTSPVPEQKGPQGSPPIKPHRTIGKPHPKGPTPQGTERAPEKAKWHIEQTLVGLAPCKRMFPLWSHQSEPTEGRNGPPASLLSCVPEALTHTAEDSRRLSPQ